MSYNVVIFTSKGDSCVNPVLNTLKAKGLKGLRIDMEDFLESDPPTYIDILNSTLEELLEAYIGVNNVRSVWFRRDGTFEIPDHHSNERLDQIITGFQWQEKQKLKDFFYRKLMSLQINCLGNFFVNRDLNKLSILQQAKEIGLNVPDTTICNDVDYVRQKMKVKLITKAICEAPKILSNTQILMGYTSIVDEAFTKSDKIAPSLFQAYIDSVFEIRAICFFGQFFTVGYYVSDKNVPDIRYYHHNENLRKFPFRLPVKTELQLKELMTLLNVDFACADLCLGRDGRIYFFEINPGGTFSGISSAFNFGLENFIAEYLIGGFVN